jgi:lipoate-protein ligase A
MALDEALMEAVRGGAEPVLRFYRWSPACLSLGRNQPAAGCYREDRLAELGLDVVRRPTGGRAVLHADELTYSVAVPEGLLGPPRATYLAINRALVAGLRRLGVAAEMQPRSQRRAATPSLAPCFREPAEGEVVVGGRKLVGSAQWREAGTTLQHGSLLLSGDQGLVSELRVDAPPVRDEPPAVLRDFLDPLPDWETLTAALAAGWRDVVGGELRRAEPLPAEQARARELVERSAGPALTWRR